MLGHLGKRTAVVAVVVAVLYFTRPLWHGLFYGIVYSPTLLILGGGGILTALAMWYVPPRRMRREETSSRFFDDEELDEEIPFDRSGARYNKFRVFGTVLVILFVVSILYSIPAGMLEQRTLAEQTMSEAERIDEFPQINQENPRVVPREVADVTTRGSVSYRQHRLGTSDIARTEDGSLAWSYPIQPEGFRNQAVENQRGVFITEMTRTEDRERVAAEEDFAVGEGMLLHRSSDWKLKKTDYWAQYNDDAVEFSHDGQPYMYYPKTGHEWHLAPFPHTTPTWKGGALVHTNGTVEHLSPEEARSHPVLEGQRLYPLTLTRVEMESLSYRNGIINQLPVVGAHENEVEVAGLPDDTANSQPFVIDLEGERLSYVMAMEPYGSDTRGLDEVWFADAETGEYTYFATEEETRTNWGENFVVTEPVPVTVDGELWWQVKVIPTDATDVARNVFVNADDGETVELRTDDAVRSFVAGEQVPDRADQPRNGTDGSGSGDSTGDSQGGDVLYYIVVTDEEGNVVERIPVRRGQDTRIVDPSESENATANG